MPATKISQRQSGNVNNYSITNQTINASVTALITGSLISVPIDKLAIGTVYKCLFSVSKTAAGTAANTFLVKIGTAGTTADATILTFTLPVGTAVVDTAIFEFYLTVRGPLSASCILQGYMKMDHNLQITGFATTPCVVLVATSAAFDSTVANLKINITCTTAALTVLTFNQVITETNNL